MVTMDNIPPENIAADGEQSKQHTMEQKGLSDHNKSAYELTREERIKENRERMQKLGLVDLSLKLNALKSTPKRAYQRKYPLDQSPLPPPGPIRRSSRLQMIDTVNVTGKACRFVGFGSCSLSCSDFCYLLYFIRLPGISTEYLSQQGFSFLALHNSTPVSYCEVRVTQKEKPLHGKDFLREEGSKPELYTEEHEKLLGSSEKSWTLFVDGYGKDGKRIYDPVKGKTCHQCRQKTLGFRTHCSKCSMVQGQFCGDCLYMRYGENVLEANENPNWICPVCRGICNCSLCRQAKGWAPTGILYRKISSLGYKSVAHYLIQTRHSDTVSDKNAVVTSAKRSLPFSDVEETKVESALNTMADFLVTREPEENGGTEMKITEEPLNDHQPLLTEPNECLKDTIPPKSLEKKGKDSEIGYDLSEREKSAKSGDKSYKLADVDSIASRLKMRRRA
ncbi:zinc-finger domain of monoamine-oxidase Arepressor R1 [Striga asiatica]|uniref:Zinc-finger domain of monoamine-oxidase Arepressor R1 n=1 Tax=Striga asiatica TaxID=4170 RepID=A0A5A7PSA9_STRAF|nr:zinc-finger domain of monoamine-oxidase Arepressor R1 [Striga asiatica]